ncbi:hypothetical protein MA16_Dca005953 [Dendrobium catenatum]|uniref:DUF4220 domain-containing protein n=1 Tax=Dendrobium catenatum TaxID=906689 RepID=A0A2I0WJT0_9ASPA|nr:hypothetical protein MA16_Dca005953 [Dendrobium catenatum]
MDDFSFSNAIIAFWAPFLILHLGGPDTITAYSIEDNELWARHLLVLPFGLIFTFYVLFRSLPNIRLLAPTLLIFLVAIIKYLERSYSLYKASVNGFRSSIKIEEDERWKVLTMMWAELIIQVAKNSRANIHMKQLSSGDKLLTFIWLLNKLVETDDMFHILLDIREN